MKLRVPLPVLTALLATGVAFSANVPQNNNTKIYQPDNNPVATSAGLTVANPGPGSSFQVIYTNNTNAFQAVKVMNTGTAGGVDPGGDICVNVYVYDTSQHFQDCCFCKVSPNGLGVMNLNGQYTPNQLVIKLVATYPNNSQSPPTQWRSIPLRPHHSGYGHRSKRCHPGDVVRYIQRAPTVPSAGSSRVAGRQSALHQYSLRAGIPSVDL